MLPSRRQILISAPLLTAAAIARAQTRPASAPAAKPIFIAINTPESLAHPELKPLSWLNIAYYIDRPRPRVPNTGPMQIWPENLRYIATKCRDGGFLAGSLTGRGILAPSGAPAALDFEGWYDLRTDAAGRPEPGSLPKERAAVVFRDYVRAFRAAAPNVPVTVWGLQWYTEYNLDAWAAGLSDAQLARLAADATIARTVLDECDMVTATCYLTEPQSIDRDLKAMPKIVRWVKAAYGKPVHVWIMPRYLYAKDPGDKPRALQPDHAARVFDMARREGDAVVIWGDWPAIEQLFLPLVNKPR